MTVYLVYSTDGDNPWLEGVFSSAEAAITWAENTGDMIDYYWVSKYEVDSEPRRGYVQGTIIWKEANNE